MIRDLFRRARRTLFVSASMLMILAGCRFEAERNILADEPAVPVSNIVGSLGGAYFQEVSGSRSVQVGLAEDGSGELTVYEAGREQKKIPFQAAYGVPGTSGAFLVAEIAPSGATGYYLLRPKEDGVIDFIANTNSGYEYDDPKVLLYWANLWAHGIAQKFQIFTLFDESASFRLVSQDDFQGRIDDRIAADEAERQERRRKAEIERQAREAVKRAFAPSKEDVVDAYNAISRNQVAVMSALAGQCEMSGDNIVSATACLMGGAGQIDHSSYSMNVIDADIRECTSVSGSVPSAICNIRPVFRAADNENAIMKLVAGLSTASGYRFVRFERRDGVWSIARTYDSCTETADGFNCTWTD